MCERVVFSRLYHFLSSVLSDCQSGFRKADSTSFQLVRLVQQWCEALDSSKYVVAVFFDLQKAFDRVWHKGLLCKLEAAGVRGAPLQWFRSYLSDHRQRTRVADAVSSTLPLSAGVPQGAILSPLLFILYVNDITQVSSADVNLFADDTSSFVADKCPHRLCARLQDTVDQLAKWFDRWLLTVNVKKSAVVLFRSVRMRAFDLDVSLGGEKVPQVSAHKHLG